MSFYAVRVGNVPGIYGTWDEAKRQIDQVENAQFKKFETHEQAEAYMKVLQPFATDVITICARVRKNDWEIELKSSQLEATYDIEKNDYPEEADAILRALTEYLQEYTSMGPYRPMIIVKTNQMHVVNVLNRYLLKWSQNLWTTHRGPVKHQKTMELLYKFIQMFPNIRAEFCK